MINLSIIFTRNTNSSEFPCSAGYHLLLCGNRVVGDSLHVGNLFPRVREKVTSHLTDLDTEVA